MVATARGQYLALAILFFCSLGVGMRASHQWDSYHRANAGVDRLYLSATGYQNIWDEEAVTEGDSWENSTDIDFLYYGSHYFQCQDHVFTGSYWYGFTGWDGLTELDCVSGSTILSSASVMNRTYVDSYSNLNLHKVACHELGHGFGLWHQDAADSCMRASATTGSAYPNSHDIELINSLY